jgi:hypothetical protein
MSQRNPIRVFVSHAWEQDEDYLRVFEYLESARNFYYRNCSTPEVMPAQTTQEGLREDLRRQIGPAEAVVALASLQQRHLDLLMFQLNYAKACDKPVVLLTYFGRDLPIAEAVRKLTDEQVGWDERALVDAIKRQARHEETTRWDTIEFKLD